MSSLGRVLVGFGATLVAVLFGPMAAAYADQTLQECMDMSEENFGEPPTCTEVDGGWEASWPDDGMGGSMNEDNFGSLIVLMIVVGVLASIAITVWKVSTARRIAEESGMDPGLATQMTLLSDNGLDATYVVAGLRGRDAATAAPAAPQPVETAAQRLVELKSLLDGGLITQAEYDKQRAVIIDAL